MIFQRCSGALVKALIAPVVIFSAGWAPASTPPLPKLNSLSPAQTADLQAGRLVTIVQEIPDAVWPRIVLFQKVNATPEEVTAVFTDYEKAVHYIPNVKVSRLEKESNSRTSEVYYELSLPLLPNERYTARNQLQTPAAGTYLISWQVASGRFFKTSQGSLQISPYEGRALMRYENIVDPGSRIAKLLRQRAVHQAEQTLRAIAEQVEKMKTDPAKLDLLVAELRKDLAAP